MEELFFCVICPVTNLFADFLNNTTESTLVIEVPYKFKERFPAIIIVSGIGV